MPNKPSAVQDLRLSLKHAARNFRIRENLRFLVRRCRRQFAGGDVAAVKPAVAAAVAAFDRAVRAGVVKAGNAARHKSRLMRRLNTLGH